MTLFLDLEDTVFNSAPNGDLLDDMTLWTPITSNIQLIQSQIPFISDCVILSYAISNSEEFLQADNVLAPQISNFFKVPLVDILSVEALCKIWKELFYLHLTPCEFCQMFTKEMVIQTLFLRRNSLFRGKTNYFFDDCVTSHRIQSSNKSLVVQSVPKPSC